MAGKGCKRRPGKGYEVGHERIFGKSKVQGGRFIRDPETGKFVPAHELKQAKPKGPYVQADFVSFKSPIDGKEIRDRNQLAQHNKRHGVTNSADYSPEYLKKRAADRHERRLCNTKEDKAHRIGLIKHQIERAQYE
jgi:hypothetical protein